MKRILMIITSLLFIICFISCNEEEKVEQINIKFVIEENIYDIKKEVNYVVNIDDIPNITEEDIEGIYYDKEYTSEYKGEKLKKDTTIVIKFTHEKELYIESCYAYFNEYIKPNRKDATIYDLKVKKYFGIFSNSIVASFEDKKAIYLYSVYSTQIYVYKEREIYNLIEAYFLGIISEDDLNRIHEINK